MSVKKSFRPKQQIGVGGIEIGPRERKYLAQVIRSSRLSYGPLSRRLEAEWAEAHESRFAVFCNSGTSALHISLAALKERYRWKDGDEVLLPAVTFVATANIVIHNNLKPVFVDVCPVTYNIDPEKLARARTRRTRAIIPVHLFGLPSAMDPIMAFARRHRLKVLEDSCETAFARYKGKPAGSFGSIGCYSTYVAHTVVTGVGGFAATSDPDLAVRLRSLMNHGRDSIYLNIDADRRAKGKKLKEIVSRRFSFVSIGHSFRVTEFEAAMGLGQMEQREKFIKARQRNARRLSEGLRDLDRYLQLPVIPPEREHTFMMYPLVLRREAKAGLVNFLEARSIETRDMLPLIGQPVYRKLFGNLRGRYPVARWIDRSGFYIGCHQYLRPAELDYVIGCIHDYFRRRR